MTTLLLIRHGENDMVGRGLAGRAPGVHLNEKGRQQAEAVAQALAKAPLKAIYSSPMERALETAAPLAERKGLEIQVCQGVIELEYGQWMGRTFKQLERIKLWSVVKNTPSQVRFPGGETLGEAQARAVAALEALAAGCGEEDLLAIFTHGDIVRLLTAHYLQMPLDVYNRLGANTTSITVLHRDKEGRTWIPHINQIAGFEIKEKKENREQKSESREQGAGKKKGEGKNGNQIQR